MVLPDYSALEAQVRSYLARCRELATFCTQNGWIDKNSLYYEIIEQNDHEVIALVQFNEILMQGTGNSAGRVPCQGRLRLLLDRYGDVRKAELL